MRYKTKIMIDELGRVDCIFSFQWGGYEVFYNFPGLAQSRVFRVGVMAAQSILDKPWRNYNSSMDKHIVNRASVTCSTSFLACW
jgi:hypothetical protein